MKLKIKRLRIDRSQSPPEPPIEELIARDAAEERDERLEDRRRRARIDFLGSFRRLGGEPKEIASLFRYRRDRGVLRRIRKMIDEVLPLLD